MRRYRVGFSRTADAQVETIESWWRENRPAGRSRYHVYWEVDVTGHSVIILAVWYAGRGSGPRL
jgi:hypothetical protein